MINFNNYQIKDQFFVDNKHSFFGGLIGLLIQPAQYKKKLAHDTQDSLRERTNRKIQNLNRKLDLANTPLLMNKWDKKRIQYTKVLEALDLCSHEYSKIITKEGRVLDVVQISPKSSNTKLPNEQYYNIHLLGASQRIGNRMFELYRESARQNVTVVAFDYSNVGYSTGRRISSINCMLADASAMVNALLEQGVPPDHITLHGFSLGGFLGTRIAEYCHKNNLPINLYACNAPMELTPCVVHVLQKNPSFITNTLKTLVNSLLNYFEWDYQAIHYWDSIPEKNKEYSYIDVMDKNTHVPDNFIPVSATIDGKHKEKGVSIDDNHRFYLAENDKAKNPHGTHQYLLKNKMHKTPEDLFDDFIKKVKSNSPD